MPRLACLVLATAAVMLAMPASAAADKRASCEWRAPADDPYVGDVPGAVDHYPDIPPPTRARLKARMAQFAYDDIVAIRRDSIEGRFRYEPALRDMHFGKRRICGNVTRQSWPADREERGLAYCEDGHCVVVPLICRNVSRIIRQPGTGTLGGGPTGGVGPLVFEPPAAGVPPAPAATEPPEPTARTLEAPAPVAPPLVAAPPLAPPLAPDLPPEAEPAPPPIWPAPAMPPLPPAPAVPEPATLLLWAAGLVVVVWAGRRRLTPQASGR